MRKLGNLFTGRRETEREVISEEEMVATQGVDENEGENEGENEENGGENAGEKEGETEGNNQGENTTEGEAVQNVS